MFVLVASKFSDDHSHLCSPPFIGSQIFTIDGKIKTAVGGNVVCLRISVVGDANGIHIFRASHDEDIDFTFIEKYIYQGSKGIKKDSTSFLLSFIYAIVSANYFFNKSLISVNNVSSFEGAGGAVGATSSFFFILFIPLITINMANAMMIKSMVV